MNFLKSLFTKDKEKNEIQDEVINPITQVQKDDTNIN